MTGNDYKVWEEYHYNKTNRKLTEEEFAELRANEFAMHLLVPTDSLLKDCGGYEKMKEIYLGDFSFKMRFVEKLAKMYIVSAEIILFKMEHIIFNQNYANVQKINKTEKNKVLKRTKNIVYVDFK